MQTLLHKISWPTLVLCLIGSFLFFPHFDLFADEYIVGFDYDNYYQADYILNSSGVNYNTDVTGVYGDNLYIKYQITSGNVLGSATSTAQFIVSSSRINLNKTQNDITDDGGVHIISGNNANGYYYDSVTRLSNGNQSANVKYYLWIFNRTGGIGKIFRLTITDSNGSKKIDYVPAVRKSDNSVGFYDLASNSFKTTNGLTYGSIVSPKVYSVSGTPVNGSVTGYGDYLEGTRVTLEASPDPGYVFDRWDNGSSDNPYTFNVVSNLVINPVFVPVSSVDTYTITVSSSNDNFGTVRGSGTYEANSSVEIVAIPNEGYSFVGWNDNNTDNPRLVLVSGDFSFVANFQPVSSETLYQLHGFSSPSSGGFISGGGYYSPGTFVQLTAIPNPGYVFAGWDDGNMDNPRFITTVNMDMVYTANFVMPDFIPFVPFEAVDDSYTAVDFNLTKLNYDRTNRLIIDDFIGVANDMRFRSLAYPETKVYLIGDYYDRSLTGVTSCRGVESSFTTTPQETKNIIADLIQWSNENDTTFTLNPNSIILNSFTNNTNLGTYTKPSNNSYSLATQTEACKLFATDGITSVYDHLDELGFEKIPISTANDYGYSETYVYVPGKESINLDIANLSTFVGEAIDNMYASFTNKYLVSYHYETDIYITASNGNVFPKFGSLDFSYLNSRGLHQPIAPFLYLDNYSIDSGDYPVMYKKDSNSVIKGSTINWYDVDYSYVTYYSDEYSSFASLDDNQLPELDKVIRKYNEWYQGSGISMPLIESRNFTINGDHTYDISSSFYKLNGSNLGLFNSLGSFLNDWFNKFHIDLLSMRSSGGSSSISGDKQDVNHQFNVDIDVDIGNLLGDFNTGVGNAHGLIGDNELDDYHKNGLAALGSSLLVPVFNLFFDNGLGIIIIIIIVLLVLGLVF